MVEFGDRNELDRETFRACLEGRQAPRLPWTEIVIPWLFSLAQLAFQIVLLRGIFHAR
jgi:hypothetical protein